MAAQVDLTGVRLAIDVGKARIGVAKSDALGMLASPLETVIRDEKAATHLKRIFEIIAEHDCRVVYVGNPINLKGQVTASTLDAHRVASEIANSGVETRLVDERLSTVSAQAKLSAGGKNVKQSKNYIDQAAAAVILQEALDFEHQSARRAGMLVENQAKESI